MPLTPGARFGGYTILSPAGAGGMGEVYRARDERLSRDVAIKILPASLAGDRDHVGRLEREARLLASLSHPNIATLFDVGREGEAVGLILEYVEGATLADQLKNGPLPIDQVRRIAMQICAALAAAHDRGVVHRDLKPSNIKVRPDGTVKVLDFGIAKASGTGHYGEAAPTATSTGAGVLIGTAAYMSPEQARGLAVDRRADTWALGCVLFEMLTGRQAFNGATTTDILAAVIGTEPDWNQLPASTPATMRRVLKRCLEKDVTRRLRDAGDGAFDLETPHAPAAPQRFAPRAVATAAAVAALLMAGWSAGWYSGATSPNDSDARRYEIGVRDVQRLADSRIALSPDGNLLAYAAVGPNGRRIFVRDLLSQDTRELPWLEPFEPFFSPDGHSIGAMSAGYLHLYDLASSQDRIICPVPGNFFGASFAADGRELVFSGGGVLYRVAAAGGAPVRLNVGVAGRVLRYPHLFDDDGSLIFAAFDLRLGTPAEIVYYDGHSGESTTVASGSDVRVSSDGSLFIVTDGALYHRRWDRRTPDRAADGTRIAPTVARTTFDGGLFATAGQQLIYATAIETTPRQLVTVDRAGRITPFDLPAGSYQQPRVSPDGAAIALENVSGVPHSIWIFNRASGALTKLITPGASHNPNWLPDGTRLSYQADRDNDRTGVYVRRADGSSPEELLTVYPPRTVLQPMSWSRDGRVLMADVIMGTRRDIARLDGNGKGPAAPWLSTPALETAPEISPDGKWVAYTSDESKRREIYVRPLAGNKDVVWPVTTEGGDQPGWSRDGTELFFMRGTALFSVPVNPGPTFIAGRARRLVDGSFFRRGGLSGRDYDQIPGTDQFVMLLNKEQYAAPVRFDVILNWRRLLQQERQP